MKLDQESPKNNGSTLLNHSIYVSTTRSYISFLVRVTFYLLLFLFLAVMFMKEFPKNTMQALQEKSHSEKAGITIGQISNIHSTKKVLTLRDYTGYYNFLFFKELRL